MIFHCLVTHRVRSYRVSLFFDVMLCLHFSFVILSRRTSQDWLLCLQHISLSDELCCVAKKEQEKHGGTKIKFQTNWVRKYVTEKV